MKQPPTYRSLTFLFLLSITSLCAEYELQRAVAQNDLILTTKWLRSGVLINQIDHFGFAAIHYSAFYNHPSLAQLLFAKGADVATQVGVPDGLVKLNIKAPPSLLQYEGFTAQGIAENQGSSGVIVALSGESTCELNPEQFTLELFHSVKNNFPYKLATLLRSKGEFVDLDQYDREGCTLLGYAVQGGLVQMTAILLACGADAKQRLGNPLDSSKKRYTPLLLAQEAFADHVNSPDQFKYDTVIKLLRACGARDASSHTLEAILLDESTKIKENGNFLQIPKKTKRRSRRGVTFG